MLVTLDMDFADIRTYPPADFPGLIALRLGRQDKPYVLDVLARLLHVLRADLPDRLALPTGRSGSTAHTGRLAGLRRRLDCSFVYRAVGHGCAWVMGYSRAAHRQVRDSSTNHTDAWSI